MDLSSIEEHLCASCNKSSESKSNLSGTAFWVNIDERCRHRFCDRCYQKEFSIKRQFACPRCKHIVNKQNLSQKDPDEIEVERDFTIRKRIKGIYNKTADSFPSDLEYKNYEETIEDVIFNLVNNIDVQLTNKQVEQYQSDHLQQIAEDQSKRQFEYDQIKEEIRVAEEIKIQKDLEEKASIIKDKILNVERVRQMNEIQLGERDKMTVPASSRNTVITPTIQPAVAFFAPSHVLSVLSSRPEPKPVRVGSTPVTAKPSGSALHSMHSAGGYEHANYSRRNWLSIIEEVTAHAESLSIVHVGVGVVHASSSSSSSSDSGTHAVLTLSGSASGGGGVSVKDIKKDSGSVKSGSSSRPWPLQWD